MPESISVAAFVVGLVLIVAALVGRQVKIAAVELPDLNRPQRSIVGALGAALVVFGLFDGQLPAWPSAGPADATLTPIINLAAGECFADVAEANRVDVALETALETYQRFGEGQPREDTFALHFTHAGNFVGSVKLTSLASGLGFNILSVVDSACSPLTTYENSTLPNQPRNTPYAYDTLRFHFGDTTVAVELFYKDQGSIEVRAQTIAP